MKRTGKSMHTIVFLCLALGFLLAGASYADAATWYMTHGNGATVQDEKDTSLVYCTRTGAGLQISLSTAGLDDATTWVHFAVPAPYTSGTGVRYLKVRVKMVLYAGLSNIPKIQVYNGETLVKEFTVNHRVSGWATISLDLKSVKKFDKGMGISVQILQDMNSGGESFLFSGAGALFTP